MTPGRAGDRGRELYRAAVRSLALCWRSAPGHVAAYLAGTVLGSLVPVALAWLTKLTLDLLAAGNLGGIAWFAAGVVAAGLIGTVVAHAGQYARAEIDRRVSVRSQNELFAAVERFAGLTRFEDPAFLDRLHLAQRSVTSPGMTIDSIFNTGRGLLMLIGFVGSVLAISPLFTTSLVAAALIALPLELRLSRRKAAAMLHVGPTERREMFYADLLSRVDAAKEVRLFGIGPFLRGRMIGEKEAAHEVWRRMDRRELTTQGGLAVLSTAVFGAGVLSTILAAARGENSIGDVSLFIAAVGGVQVGLAGLVGAIASAHHQLLTFGRYLEVLGAGPDLPQPVVRRPAPRLRYGIELRDVWFRYSDDHPWVLRGLDLAVPYGRSMALVGRNGAGKSTIVKLLCRFYDPTRGAVLWDGVDIRELDIAELRTRIGAVFQDFVCYDLSARDNIAVGDLTALDRPDRIADAAAWAGMHTTLQGLPRGYDTLLTRMFTSDGDTADEHSGVVLSGGQWQRLALARAFLRGDRDLMVLDEPSAGMDAETEHELHTRLQVIREGRTSLLISHRLGAIRAADRIAVLADGTVAELGTHRDLMDLGGLYARLFTLQAAGYAAETAPGGRA